MSLVLDIEDLHVVFSDEKKEIHAVNGVNLTVNVGEVVALVGESGCGKTLTALSVMGLLKTQYSAPVDIRGAIRYTGSGKGVDLLKLSSHELDRLRGNEIAMIFQDPITSLNPLMKVGDQIKETIVCHMRVSSAPARQAVMEIMKKVGFSDVERRYHAYPHQLSGGQCQRILIAMAMILDPQLLIADEPTTALDVTIQAQILSLLHAMRQKRNRAQIIVTHNLGIVAQIAHRVAIMYSGKIVEEGQVTDIFANPLHPYTKKLLASIPRMDAAADDTKSLPVIPGAVPSPQNRPTGCAFHPRCDQAMRICKEELPGEIKTSGRVVCCHIYDKYG